MRNSRDGIEARLRPPLVWMGLILLGLCGMAAVLYATPWGAGLGGDSYYYVSGARNLISGLGFSRPAADGGIRAITHYPPGYSIALGAFTALGSDTLLAARWLDASLFGVNILLLGLMVYRATASGAPAILAALLMLGSPALLVVHTWVLSEALFLSLTLLTVLALARAVEPGSGWWIAAAGLTAALAYLTRYVGLALILSGCVTVLAFGVGSPKRRIIQTLAFGAIAVLGPVIWSARNIVVSGSVAYSAAQLHPPSIERVIEAAETISLWVLPNRVPSSVRMIAASAAVAAVIGASIFALRQRGDEGRDRAIQAHVGSLLSLAVVYPLSLVGALTLVGSSVPLDDRILSPLLVALIGLGVLVGWVVWRRLPRPAILRWGITLAACGFAALMLARGAGALRRLQADGQGTAARAWQESALVDWVRRLPENVPIYSNELDVLYLYTGRQAFQVPIRWDPVVEAPRQDYDAQLSAMRTRLAEQGAVLVLFDTIGTQSAFLPPREELTQGLVEIYDSTDGSAYAASGSGPWTRLEMMARASLGGGGRP